MYSISIRVLATNNYNQIAVSENYSLIKEKRINVIKHTQKNTYKRPDVKINRCDLN